MSAPGERQEANHIAPLDGLRGIAVLLVIVFHFSWTFPLVGPLAKPLKLLFWSGWIGVDLFFVLSGYLITRGLVAESTKATGTRLKLFWMRRVLRIFPLYYVVLIFGTIVGLFFNVAPPVWSYWVYMQNYTLAFDTFFERWTAHFWSLAIEEQFYFVWPILALMVPRKKMIPMTITLIAACFLLRAGLAFKLHIWPAETTIKFLYRATFTRADGLLLGALVAILQHEQEHPVARFWKRIRKVAWFGSGLMLLGLAAAAHGLNGEDRRVVVVGYFLLAFFFAATVSFASDGSLPDGIRRLLMSPPLVACGKVSYGMYLFHWLLVVTSIPWLEWLYAGVSPAVRVVLGLDVIVLGGLLTYGIAAASFTYIEAPFLRLKSRFHG